MSFVTHSRQCLTDYAPAHWQSGKSRERAEGTDEKHKSRAVQAVTPSYGPQCEVAHMPNVHATADAVPTCLSAGTASPCRLHNP